MDIELGILRWICLFMHLHKQIQLHIIGIGCIIIIIILYKVIFVLRLAILFASTGRQIRCSFKIIMFTLDVVCRDATFADGCLLDVLILILFINPSRK